jgi:N-acetylglucosamine kinase-like BadF-type ATPase
MYQPPWSAMKNDLSQDLVVGLDVGGTRIRAVLAPAVGGPPLGHGRAGPGNAISVPAPLLADRLAEAIGLAVPPARRDRVRAVVGGFAGAARTSPDEPGRRAALAALGLALDRLGIAAATDVYSDIEAAFASAPGTPADGLALVAGTGSVAARIAGRDCVATVDGNGWLLGDDGSGFWIGRGAVRAALRMADGRGNPTVLAGSVARALLSAGELPEVLPAEPTGTWSSAARERYRMLLVPTVMAEPPVRLARLAPLVARAARNGDAVAAAILAEAVDHLTATVRALRPKRGDVLVATGGLLGPDGPLMDGLRQRLANLGLGVEWTRDGRQGAVALARLLCAAS